MRFMLKENTENGGLSLHNSYGYAMCPYRKSQTPCGTWCALFHPRISESRAAVKLGCSSETVFIVSEDIEAT